jgi:hypothetical protein
MSIRSLTAGALLLALAMTSDRAHADCTLVDWSVEGVVVDADGAPVADAQVEARWEERENGTMSNRRDADALGRFSNPVQFDPYSGRTFGGTEKCEAELEAVTLVVSKRGFRTTEMRVVPDQVDGPVRVVLQRTR